MKRISSRSLVVALVAMSVVLGLSVPSSDAAKVRWVRRWSDFGYANTQVAVGGDQVYAVSDGRPGTRPLLRAFALDGTVRWRVRFGHPGVEIYAAAADRTGVYLAGRTYGRFPGEPDGRGADAFVAYVHRGGSGAWARQFSGEMLEPCTPGEDWICPDLEEVWSIAVGRRAVYVAGRTQTRFAGQAHSGGWTDAFLGKFSRSGRRVWLHQFGPAWALDVAIGAGRVFVVGEANGRLPGQVQRGPTDPFVRAYRPNGTVAWTRQFGTWTRGEDHANAVAYLDGTVIVGGGRCCGDRDSQITMAGFGVRGRLLWGRRIWGSPDHEWVSDATTAGGRAVFVGGTNGAFPGYRHAGVSDLLALAMRADGQIAWTWQAGSRGDDGGRAIAGRSDSAYIGGTASGRLLGTTGTVTDGMVLRVAGVRHGPPRA